MRMVVQPCNRGTLPATLWSLMRVVRLDPRAVVTFFPSDHYYSDEGNFIAGVMVACEAAEAGSPSVILLGAPARHAETGFGWIEAEPAASGSLATPLLRVKRFWEKPSASHAARLLKRGCVWNTFVMVGCVQAFLDMIASAAPDLYRLFAAVGHDREENAIEPLYQTISATDFSMQVLSSSADRLAVLCLGDVGWSDLGDPHRVMNTLSQNGLESPQLMIRRREASSQPAVMRAGSAQCA
jgi:mannose-1-phosphate guanylyltransferase